MQIGEADACGGIHRQPLPRAVSLYSFKGRKMEVERDPPAGAPRARKLVQSGSLATSILLHRMDQATCVPCQFDSCSQPWCTKNFPKRQEGLEYR